jgi:diguanylate cyclase (GGDEF)-like protein
MMRGHSVTCIGVIKGDTFLGVVRLEDLVGVGDAEPIELVMRRGTETVAPDMPIRRLAEMMSDKKLDSVPVLHDEEFLGIVTAQSLLSELWRNYDPLTQLSWSDALREWGIAQLAASREVTILFIDIDKFGDYNKRHGHLVGDRVLQEVAAVLQRGVDPETDFLCRYGGDEFALATLRPRQEAEHLASWLEMKIAGLHVQDADRRLTVSIGIRGGMRTKERENTHYAATLDNLINLASREAMAKKIAKATPAKEETREGEPAPTLVPEPRPTPELLSARTTEASGLVRAVVVLRLGTKLFTGIAEDVNAGVAAARATTDAASNAVNMDAVLQSVQEAANQVSAVITVEGVAQQAAAAVSGTVGEAAARAVLAALAKR